MIQSASSLACAGCGAPAGGRPLEDTFRCSRAAERVDVDHVMRRALDVAHVGITPNDRGNPFLRYRQFLHSYQFGLAHGMRDADFVAIVTRVDEAVARIAGHGFTVTPLVRGVEIERQLGIRAPGAVWIKDETGNVSGSHKARHLMGLMLYLEVVDALGLDRPRRRGLAIASCGNAALAAAVVARAAGYSLRVFVPAAADRSVIARISDLGAEIVTCPRQSGVGGDPSFLRFRDAVAGGALPFCCQGSENGLTIDGGETIAYEIAESLPDTRPRRMVVQVGGGALAASCVQAFAEMRAAAGMWPPRFHAVQTSGAYPLKRAFDRVTARLDVEHGYLPGVDAAMRYARTHRSAFMQPWETEPRSVAHGILDDETYDWAALVEGMLQTGGSPIVVSEEELREANTLARHATGIDVDHTGSAGLAGLTQLVSGDATACADQHILIFSGVKR